MAQKDCLNIKKINHFLCIECINCKTRNGLVYCKEGHFIEKKNKSLIYMPIDFDCYEWEEA
jgi:hypothetical protein